MNYGSFEELQEKLLYKKIKFWNSGELILEDGTLITIEMSESDCCATAGGEFDVLQLDAVITHVALTGKRSQNSDFGETTNYATVVLLHNQNEIARANCFADDGNGGYYYSVCSLVVTGVHYPVVRA